MWQRFTERARKVVFFAQEEAQARGDEYVSDVHLLLGLLREDDSVAARVLARLGFSRSELMSEIESRIPNTGQYSFVHMSLSPRGKRVIDLAYREAKGLKNKYIGTEHILLGLIREGDGKAAQILARHKVDLDEARRFVLSVQDAGPEQSATDIVDWSIETALHGEVVRLEPINPHHAHDLAQACDEHMFDFFPLYPESFDSDGLEKYIEVRARAKFNRTFAVIHLESCRAIGSSSMFDISPQNKTLEIGHTWIKKEFRGTDVNPEMKLLMLQHAFEVLACNRVQLKTDARNLQSQAAIKKLGAKYEGTLRSHMVMPDGHIRDTVYFSIISEEWPGVKRGLLERLGRS